ncbi:bifunctional diaminohydroxyphosphoribosylaminopyrimidine deaminase/5-amino-6-(5-phosphoribosylamino)uracil reductase RibD [Lysinibacillus sp. KU-BSD001]|uniref:bifunctional diaminohydroxyphosphoribosylaminopyrimidine deaminase/5-amino-6-(5-phosphoribosylamino)uracil reductase RibD n=1 Tax=Lysinibacillus sp. KU-BSD001 TaxID=3141328 RepID=UPI0036E0DB99
MKNDQYYMQLALDLAASATGKTNPNPLVGSVIVKDGAIVGTGLHRKAGEPHAEVHAVRMAGEHAKDATIYVTLEPCSHFGKTPPCANLVKEAGVKRVVIAMEDPNPAVAGRGIQLLRDAGIEVEVGVLEIEARRLNERFIHNMITARPFVISKFAMTLDGKIAAYNGHSQWITGEEARADVHELRDQVDAILVGIGTVLTDNPSLTTRLPDRVGKNPIRIVLDRQLRTPLDATVCQTSTARTIIVTAEEQQHKAPAFEKLGVELLYVPVVNDQLDLNTMLDELYKRGITDILVEGGGEVNASFLRAGLIQKFLVYVAPKVLGGRNSITPFTGTDVETVEAAMLLDFAEVEKVGADLRITAYPKEG